MTSTTKNNKNTAKLLTAVGLFFYEKRIDADCTQREAAECIGVNPQYISNIERGRCPFPNTYKKKLLKLYKVDPNEFFDFMMEEQGNFLRSELGIRS